MALIPSCLTRQMSGLSERIEVDCWVVKVSGQSRDILFKKTPSIKKEMPSRVAGQFKLSRWRFSAAAGYFWQPWMLANFWELNSGGLNKISGKERESCCLVFPSSTNVKLVIFTLSSSNNGWEMCKKKVMHVCNSIQFNSLFHTI